MKNSVRKNLAKSKDFGHEESVGFALSSGALVLGGGWVGGGYKIFYLKKSHCQKSFSKKSLFCMIIIH